MSVYSLLTACTRVANSVSLYSLLLLSSSSIGLPLGLTLVFLRAGLLAKTQHCYSLYLHAGWLLSFPIFPMCVGFAVFV